MAELLHGRWLLGDVWKDKKRSGRYYFRLEDKRTGETLKKSTGETSKRRAQTVAKEYVEELRAAGEAPAKEAAAREFGDAYREFLRVKKKPHVRASTLADYESTFTGIYEPALGHLRLLSEFDVAAVEEFLADQSEKAPKTKHKYLVELRAFSKWCVLRKYLSEDPTAGQRLPRGTRRAGRALNEEEARRLVAACFVKTEKTVEKKKGSRRNVKSWTQTFEPPKYLPLAVVMALTTGLRRGSMLSVGWSDVDLDGGWVRRSAEDQKDDNPIRIPIHPDLRTLLEREKKKKGPVFPVAEITKSWRRVCTVAGLDGLRWHDCRHTYSNWLRRRTNAAVRDLLVGHAAPRGISGIYSHPEPEELVEAIESLPRLLPGS